MLHSELLKPIFFLENFLNILKLFFIKSRYIATYPTIRNPFFFQKIFCFPEINFPVIRISFIVVLVFIKNNIPSMDKSQRQLIDTYFRKRKIAGEQSIGDRYQPYEFDYLTKDIKNNINKFNKDDIAYLIDKHPQLVEYFKDRLEELDEHNITGILYHYPQLIKYFKDRLGEISHENIRLVLSKQPSLVDYFKDKLGEMTDYQIREILYHQPQLAKYFPSQ